MKSVFKLLFISFFLTLACLLFIQEKKSDSTLLFESNIEALASNEGGSGGCHYEGSIDCGGNKVRYKGFL